MAPLFKYKKIGYFQLRFVSRTLWFKCFTDQLWRITEDNKLINKNGHWKYENVTLTTPDEGSEGYIQDNRGKIIRLILLLSRF